MKIITKNLDATYNTHVAQPIKDLKQIDFK
jgi:hypothetical protein